MNLLIAVPTYETIVPETFQSIYELDKTGIDNVDFKFVKGYDCARARNEICKKAIEGKYDFLLMVDSDIILPKDTLQLLLNDGVEPSELVLGVFPKKNTKKHETDIFSFNLDTYCDGNRYHMSEFNQLRDKGIKRIAVRGGGFGCALINVSVLRVIPAPWFIYVTYPNGMVLSEDLYFCSRLRDFAYQVTVDPRIHCGHLTRLFQYE